MNIHDEAVAYNTMVSNLYIPLEDDFILDGDKLTIADPPNYMRMMIEDGLLVALKNNLSKPHPLMQTIREHQRPTATDKALAAVVLRYNIPVNLDAYLWAADVLGNDTRSILELVEAAILPRLKGER